MVRDGSKNQKVRKYCLWAMSITEQIFDMEVFHIFRKQPLEHALLRNLKQPKLFFSPSVLYPVSTIDQTHTIKLNDYANKPKLQNLKYLKSNY